MSSSQHGDLQWMVFSGGFCPILFRHYLGFFCWGTFGDFSLSLEGGLLSVTRCLVTMPKQSRRWSIDRERFTYISSIGTGQYNIVTFILSVASRHSCIYTEFTKVCTKFCKLGRGFVFPNAPPKETWLVLDTEMRTINVESSYSKTMQWRRHKRWVGCVHTPCQENTYFLCTWFLSYLGVF